VLVGLGWLERRRVDEWRQGRIPYLEAGVSASLGKISTAMKVFRQWAAARGLKASDRVRGADPGSPSAAVLEVGRRGDRAGVSHALGLTRAV
jgi:hypothetical protein